MKVGVDTVPGLNDSLRIISKWYKCPKCEYKEDVILDK